MKLLLIVTFSCLFSFSVLAEMWESNTYTDYTIVADNGEISFRFSTAAGYSVCETGAVFAESLLKIQDGTRHRVYLLNATIEATGVTGACDTGEPIILLERLQVVKSKWYKLSDGHSATIIVPRSVTIEIK